MHCAGCPDLGVAAAEPFMLKREAIITGDEKVGTYDIADSDEQGKW